MSALLLCVSAALGAGVTVAYDQAGGRFEVRGLSPAARAALADPAARAAALRVSVDGDDGRPSAGALLGTSGVSDGVLWLRPRFPLAPGLRHTAAFDPSGLPGGGAKLLAEVTPAPPAATAPVEVSAVYPSGDRLPENLLKFYLHFSAPVRRGEAYQRVRLLDAAGQVVDAPFLELGEELWDPQGVRLTLLIDPGRVKRGLKSREGAGPVLEAGRSYTLSIDGGWPDAAGRPLRSGFRKTFTAVAFDADRPDPPAWTLLAPPAADAALEVRFPEPLDRALLDRALWVEDATGRRVDGRVEVGDAETRWAFRPSRPWAAGNFVLRVADELEDVAGNRPGRLFDADALAAPAKAATLSVPFRVGGR